jgi:hypothetical protein
MRQAAHDSRRRSQTQEPVESFPSHRETAHLQAECEATSRIYCQIAQEPHSLSLTAQSRWLQLVVTMSSHYRHLIP